MTIDEFIKREIAVWGEDHVESLIDKNFVPVLLSDGRWNWLLTTAENYAKVVRSGRARL